MCRTTEPRFVSFSSLNGDHSPRSTGWFHCQVDAEGLDLPLVILTVLLLIIILAALTQNLALAPCGAAMQYVSLNLVELQHLPNDVCAL